MKLKEIDSKTKGVLKIVTITCCITKQNLADRESETHLDTFAGNAIFFEDGLLCGSIVIKTIFCNDGLLG